MLQSGYRGDASLLLRTHSPIHRSNYKDVLWLQLSVQQGCGGDFSWWMEKSVVTATKSTNAPPSFWGQACTAGMMSSDKSHLTWELIEFCPNYKF